MKINRLKINIEEVYISKPLEHETYLKIINDHHGTIHSLYLITNELKAMHYFLSLDDHPDYSITAYVNVNHGYCGKAKQQVGVIKTMANKIKTRPFYTIVYKVLQKSSLREEFSFKHVTSNKNEVYKLIDIFHKKTENLCKVNTF